MILCKIESDPPRQNTLTIIYTSGSVVWYISQGLNVSHAFTQCVEIGNACNDYGTNKEILEIC